MAVQQSKPIRISPAKARAMFLNAQLLDGRTKLRRGKAGVLQTIEHLGYIQIDTIAVIERAHHHTLWTRRADYQPDMLGRLLSQDRKVFEYWGHAASYLPISDYRYYLPRMKAARDPLSKWMKTLSKQHGKLMKPLLARIRKNGPATTRQLSADDESRPGPWWGWKPTKVALELLFLQGELMTTARRNFERVYDLTERVLPSDIDTRVPDSAELGRFLVNRALSALGAASEREIRDHIQTPDNTAVALGLRDLQESGEVVPVTLGKTIPGDYYALADIIENSSKLRNRRTGLHLLSPFDNLVIQRGRLKRLFDFDYTIECYVPAAKRKFGYFTLPILWRGEMVGRLDPKADRKSKTFLIRKLFVEDPDADTDEFYADLGEKLQEFAQFNNCDLIKIEATLPRTASIKLRRFI